jgi:acyl-coenzyme A thioesterase PaaI-like protein
MMDKHGEKEREMSGKAFQDCFPEEFTHCFGCGRLNEDGLQIKSYWDGEETVCHYTPQSYYTGGFPGFVYGGFIASLIDCHSSATASAAKSREEGFSLDDRPLSRFVTASLKVDFLKPTPMERALELRSRITEIKNRKVIVLTTLFADSEICAKGEAVMVQIPENQKWTTSSVARTGYNRVTIRAYLPYNARAVGGKAGLPRRSDTR